MSSKYFHAALLAARNICRPLRDRCPRFNSFPTGGVSLATAEEFLAAGAFALGVGGDLVDAKAAREGRTSVITENAQKYISIVKKFRGAS